MILPQEATVVTQEGRRIVVSPGEGGRPAFVFDRGDNTAPNAIYEGFRAQRRELSNQLDELESTRSAINTSLAKLPASDPARKALEERLGEVDKRIATVDGMLATNSAQLAQAAAVPGAVVQPPRPIRQGPPEEAYIVGTVFMLVVLLPLSIALARRIWKKSVVTVTAFPRELADRLSRMENAVEATSLEVERIGEGQRFLTNLLTQKAAVQALPAGGSSAAGGNLLERKQ